MTPIQSLTPISRLAGGANLTVARSWRWGTNLDVVEHWSEVPTWLSLRIGGRGQLFVVKVPTPLSPHMRPNIFQNCLEFCNLVNAFPFKNGGICKLTRICCK